LVARLIKTTPEKNSRTFSGDDDGAADRATKKSPGNRSLPRQSILKEPETGDSSQLLVPRGLFQRVSFMQNRRAPTTDSLRRGLYVDLIDSDPFKRGVQVGVKLHQWRSKLSAGESITLTKCLEGVAPDRRHKIIDAYWDASERLARYQLFEEEFQILNALLVPTAQLRQQPGGNSAMLRLQAGKAAATADVMAEMADMFEAQFDLTVFVGRPIGGKLLVPSTPPHSGRYDLRFDSQLTATKKSREVQQSKSMIPILHAALIERSGAIVHFDAARLAALSGNTIDTARIDAALDSIYRQTNEALSFLDAETKYNQWIVEYALGVLPADTPVHRFISALVVTQEARVGPSG
jgi:hypothetical protein